MGDYEIELPTLSTPFSVVLYGDAKDLSSAEALQAWKLLEFVEKQIETRKAVFRERMLRDAEQHGDVTAKGSHEMSTSAGEIVREKRMSRPDKSRLLALLGSKGIDALEGCDEVKELKVNPSKVDHLVETGRLGEDEVEELRKVTWALRVRPDKTLKRALEEAKSAADKLREGHGD